MKKITMILAMALAVSTAFAFTGGETVNYQAVNSFNSEFIKATDASWTVSKNFDKVTFTLNDEKLEAYYNKTGELMAVTHNISTVQLPASLKKSLKKLMGNSWITDLFEITNLDDTSWYVTIETADSKVVLTSHNGGKWTVFQKSNK